MSSKPNQGHMPVMKIIWVAFTVTILLFGFVLQMSEAPAASSDTTIFQAAFGLMALMCAALALWLPMVIYTNNKKTANAEVPPYYIPWILRMVLFDQVAVAGFVLAFMTGQDSSYWPFAAVTLVAYGLSYPSENRLKAIFD